MLILIIITCYRNLLFQVHVTTTVTELELVTRLQLGLVTKLTVSICWVECKSWRHFISAQICDAKSSFIRQLVDCVRVFAKMAEAVIGEAASKYVPAEKLARLFMALLGMRKFACFFRAVFSSFYFVDATSRLRFDRPRITFNYLKLRKNFFIHMKSLCFSRLHLWNPSQLILL